jgi:hypothetical protein
MIDIKDLSEEEIESLKKQFLEKRIIQTKDILKPIEEYFWKFDFNADTQAYELYLGVPKDWLHDMTMDGYAIQLFNESDNGKIIKLGTTSDDHIGDIDELILFAIDIIDRNHAILSKIREKENELKKMKEKMVEIQMGLDREIEKLKKIQTGDESDEEETEEDSPEEKPNEEPTTVTVEVNEGAVYKPPVTMSQEEADKFVQLVKNGK